ncbi:transmembrane protein 147 [Galendromus occidentalis]|uniref:BOS complex subunit TMEM147 n=1 Tax=Galendromus occidentalis TaxID=34638 RepID=A0AAJ6QT52_9ACAR|nr:transmembrane protein 147 [Galendromus occidentalis]
MTLIHFLNCLSLAAVPYVITYRLSGLSEHGCFWKCVQAASCYAVCQLGKMLFLATFVIDSVPYYGEALRHSMEVLDLVVLQTVMSRGGVYGDLRFLVTGFSWAAAEFIFTRLLPFWVGARGVEFSWRYLQMALDSNIGLVFHLSTAILLAQWKSSERSTPLVLALILLTYRAALFDALPLDPWALLAVKACASAVIGLSALSYTLNNNQKGYSNVFH